MTTATYDVAASIQQRVAELDALINHAKKYESKDESLYNAICRAAAVLLASHLEGFLKDLIRALVLDLNYYLKNFAGMPVALQRAFCHKIVYYESVPQVEVDKRIKQLTSFFLTNSVVVDMAAFAYKENSNKNPSVGFIDKMLRDLGVPDVLTSLEKSYFEVVFDDDARTDYLLRRDLLRVRSYLYQYPFKKLPLRYKFHRMKNTKENKSSLWYDFVETIMQRRHRVAHGDSLTNEATWELLQRDKVKLEVLMYGIVYSSTTYISSLGQS